MLTKEIVLLHDNAWPHTAGLTCNLLDSSGWEVLDHPQYSRGIAPSDYHTFLHLQQHLSGKRYDDDDDVKTEGNSRLAERAASFYTEVT
jgi:histone-lysine N-methyltransferase SETMAR